MKKYVLLLFLCNALLMLSFAGSLYGVETQPQASPTAVAATPTPAAPTPTPVPMPDKWQKFWLDRVEEFKKENAALPAGQKNIVFLGDSLTQGFKLKDYFPGLPVLNRGIVSDGVCNFPSAKLPWRGITHRLKECVNDCNPSHIFFLIGTNDVGMDTIPLEYWLGAYKFVIGQARRSFPEVKITLVTCPPTGLKYARHENLNKRLLLWNDLVRKTATEENCRLIDLYSLLVGKDGLMPEEMTRDGLHFNNLGYDRWAQKVREILREDGVIKEQ